MGTEAPACYLCGDETQYKFEQEGCPVFRCTACCLERIYPQPDDAALAAIYNRSYFRIYGSDEVLSCTRRMKQRTFERLLRLIAPIRRGSRLLDCGAGTGFLVDFARQVGLDAYAVEYSDYGAQQCATMIGNDHVFRGEVQQSRFQANPDHRYEIITMVDFIEHVRDPRSVLLWAFSHLSPKGNLLIVTPSLGSMSHKFLGRQWPQYKAEHLWYFDSGCLTRLLVQCGFSVQTAQPNVKYLSPQYIISINRAYKSHPLIDLPCALADWLLPGWLKTLNIPLRTGDILIHASI